MTMRGNYYDANRIEDMTQAVGLRQGQKLRQAANTPSTTDQTVATVLPAPIFFCRVQSPPMQYRLVGHEKRLARVPPLNYVRDLIGRAKLDQHM